MSTQTGYVAPAARVGDRPAATEEKAFSKASSAFGLAAAIAVIFNTLLAWVKDAYDPLNTAMAQLTGHHWITHGLLDLVVFFGLGVIFLKTGTAEKMTPNALTVWLVGAVVISGLGLAAWFLVA